MAICCYVSWPPLAASDEEAGWSHTGERWLRRRSRIPLNCRLVNKARLGSEFQFRLEWIPKLLSVRGGSTQSLFLPSRVSNAKSFQQRAVALKLNSKQHKQGRTGTRTQTTRSCTSAASSSWLNVSDEASVSCLFFCTLVKTNSNCYFSEIVMFLVVKTNVIRNKRIYLDLWWV